MTTEWQFWYSQDREAWQGPYDTRDDAIKEGRGTYKREGFYICEARVEDYHQMEVDPGEVLEQVSDRYLEYAGPDTSLFDDVSSLEQSYLGNALTEAFHNWVEQHDIKTGIYAFAETRNEEEIPAP